MNVTRRRFLKIAGSTTAAGLLCSITSVSATKARSVWRGMALGAPSEIVVDGPSISLESDAISAIRAEIERLERLFSLYRPNSAISRLNANGRLEDPDPDFIALLSLVDRVHAATNGAFDPTVQPLWSEAVKTGHPEQVDPAQIGWRNVHYDSRSVGFNRTGMSITLNGIAQGYITDRIVERLVARGLKHVVVNLGEWRADGPRQDGSSWPVQIAKTNGDPSPHLIHLNGDALAVSSGDGTTIPCRGGTVCGHIFDPNTRHSRGRSSRVAIKAPTAAIADGLSTGLCLLEAQEQVAALRLFPGAKIVPIA